MSVTFFTENSQELLNKFNQDIRDGVIDTWRVEERDGHQCYIMISPHHEKEAFFKVLVDKNVLQFFLFKDGDNNNEDIEKDAYAYYSGAIMDAFLLEGTDYFKYAVVTATPVVDISKINFE
ncbi:hypothetical protein [Swingsia samuiensis]|uniref:Uncharacterized protein n=1 Tax=Swingsia samuiensis TaxID=1293412 RepID=A0A4Y6UMD2_9PROT|nr:hypothetical protein [Swingsia samuiensis]QDH17551.1 hypothetical protein E3D00_08245 [Swingsia samuiensis]